MNNIIKLTLKQIQEIVEKNRIPVSISDQKEISVQEKQIITQAANNYGFSYQNSVSSIIPVSVNEESYSGAVLLVKGDYSVKSKCIIETENGEQTVNLFIYQQTVTDQRYRQISNNLIKDQLVVLYPGCDAEYLYEVLVTEEENDLWERINRCAKSLPIFQVIFSKGQFKIEVVEMM